MTGIEVGYFADVPILNGLDVRVDPGEMVAIVGPNGAGKSTLVKVVIGLLVPWRGKVRLRGADVTGLKPHRIVGRGVGYVAQRDNVFPSLTVDENLELGGLARGSASPAERTEAMYALFPRLAERRQQAAGTLSGGERQMLALARALVAEPEILLLDEPSAGLSPVAVDLIFEKIAEINAGGIAVLMVEQNARRALEMSHRGYVLDTGQTRFEGAGPELVRDPKVVDLYLGGRGRIDAPPDDRQRSSTNSGRPIRASSRRKRARSDVRSRCTRSTTRARSSTSYRMWMVYGSGAGWPLWNRSSSNDARRRAPRSSAPRRRRDSSAVAASRSARSATNHPSVAAIMEHDPVRRVEAGCRVLHGARGYQSRIAQILKSGSRSCTLPRDALEHARSDAHGV